MKKILLILAMMLFAGCEHSNEPEQTYYCSINDITYQTEDAYNKNCFIFNWHDCPEDEYEKGYTKCKCTERDCWLIESSSSSEVVYSSSSYQQGFYCDDDRTWYDNWYQYISACGVSSSSTISEKQETEISPFQCPYTLVCEGNKTYIETCVDNVVAAAAASGSGRGSSVCNTIMITCNCSYKE